MAGFSDRDSIWLATIPGGTNFLFTIVGLLLVDRIGRRTLLIASVCGVIVSLLVLSGTFLAMDRTSQPTLPIADGYCQYDHCGSCVGNSECGFCVDWDKNNSQYFNGTCSRSVRFANGSVFSKYRLADNSCQVAEERALNLSSDAADTYKREWFFNHCPGDSLAPLAVFALFLYIACFAPGFGPLPWTINSEIYPTWARSTAISIATMFNWSFNLLVSMTFLTMSDALGQPLTFGVYACLTFIGLIFIVLFVPETKGRSLEDMEALFQRPYFVSWWHRK